MKLNPNILKVTPKNLGFNFCVFGDPTQEIMDWINHWKLKYEKVSGFTNIFINDKNINEIFDVRDPYEYIDGFSPNLNKHLHLGHLSNLIFAKSLQKLGLGKKFIAILGDTISGSVDKNDALKKYKEYINKFNYSVDDIYFASEQKLNNSSMLEDGTGEYIGTKVFNTGNGYVVGIKSSGHTTYFYQDVALAEKLGKTTLYVTGIEQKNHFNLLSNMYNHIDHVGLGLVTVNGKKMSSSDGNVIFAENVIDMIVEKFNGNEKLAWNVISGYILKYDPSSVKNIDIKSIDNVKTSLGLYLSYTLAKMKSAGMNINSTNIKEFNSNALKFKLIKSKVNLSPNILFEELVNHTKEISKLYVSHTIKDNVKNQKMFQPLVDDLMLGMNLLGMFDIDKV